MSLLDNVIEALKEQFNRQNEILEKISRSLEEIASFQKHNYLESNSHIERDGARPESPLFFDLKRGKEFTSKELHMMFKVKGQGGIRISLVNKIIFLVSAAKTSELNQTPYGDKYDEESGVLHYVGEGKYGDQEMTRLNESIRVHSECGEEERFRIFYFQMTGSKYPKKHICMGEMKYDSWSWDKQRDPNGKLRRVIIFKLTRCK